MGLERTGSFDQSLSNRVNVVSVGGSATVSADRGGDLSAMVVRMGDDVQQDIAHAVGPELALGVAVASTVAQVIGLELVQVLRPDALQLPQPGVAAVEVELGPNGEHWRLLLESGQPQELAANNVSQPSKRLRWRAVQLSQGAQHVRIGPAVEPEQPMVPLQLRTHGPTPSLLAHFVASRPI